MFLISPTPYPEDSRDNGEYVGPLVRVFTNKRFIQEALEPFSLSHSAQSVVPFPRNPSEDTVDFEQLEVFLGKI